MYFCGSHSPCQCGTDVKTNGLLCGYVPEGTDLCVHTLEHLLAVENELNSAPRHVLTDVPQLQPFTALLASESPSTGDRLRLAPAVDTSVFERLRIISGRASMTMVQQGWDLGPA